MERNNAGEESGWRPDWRKLEALGILALALLAVYFLAVSWRKWPDPIADSGLQWYGFWRLAQGAVLYHDVTWNYGPLSAYFNAGAVPGVRAGDDGPGDGQPGDLRAAGVCWLIPRFGKPGAGWGRSRRSRSSSQCFHFPGSTPSATTITRRPMRMKARTECC